MEHPEKIVTLPNWGWGFEKFPDGSGCLVFGSPSGAEQIRYPMTPDTVRKMRQEMLGIDIVRNGEVVQ